MLSSFFIKHSEKDDLCMVEIDRFQKRMSVHELNTNHVAAVAQCGSMQLLYNNGLNRKFLSALP